MSFVPTPLLKSCPPPIDLNCRMVAQIRHDGKPLADDRGGEFLVDLSGGANVIEWNPDQRVLVDWAHGQFVERGLDSYSLRVWKRRHGPLDVGGGASPYQEPAYTDPWATWLDQHMDLRFLIAGVEFQIMSVEPYRNGVNYWLTGRRVA